MRKNDFVNRGTVMCDLDDGRLKVATIKKRFLWLASILFPEIKFGLHCVRSPSGKGWHFWAIQKQEKFYPVGSLPWVNVLLVQCLMGSDMGRERANLERIASGVEDWNRLFSTRRMGTGRGLDKRGLVKQIKGGKNG